MTYSIAEVAKKCGITVHTIRYYDKEGLLPFVQRDISGARRFTDEDFEWLSLISCLKNTGMQIKDIKTFIDWYREGDATIPKRYEFFLNHKKEVEKQIDTLKAYMDKIDYKIDFYKKALNG